MIFFKKQRFLVTAALPYVNNVPHLGNIVGSHLPADVYARYLRLCGHDVLLIGGSDEHGTATEVAALKQGISPQQLCDKYYELHQKIYQGFEISYDNFSRTSRDVNHETTREIFKAMYENGYVFEDNILQAYCPKCEKSLADRYIEGECPHCGSDSARGDQCDACGKLLNPSEIIRPKCAVCGTTPVFEESKHLFFDLPKISSELKNWLNKNKHWKENARRFALSWIKTGLKPRCITRDLSWGVKVPLKGWENKVFYVWFDAPIGYISSTKEAFPKKWEKYWQDPDTKIIHFIGKDNIPFHAIMWPGMLMAANKKRPKKYTLPWQLGSFEYLNYEGDKFSKSRGVGVFCDKALELYPADYYRYVLISLAPEKSDSDFSWKEFQTRINNELADGIGNFVNRTLTFINRFFGKKIPPLKAGSKDKKMLEKIAQRVEKTGKNIYEVRYKDALRETLMLAKDGNAYLNENEPWKLVKTNPERAATVLAICANTVATLSTLLHPFLPKISEEIRRQIGLKKTPSWQEAKKPVLETGHEINEPKVLVKKIEDAEVEKYEKMFGGEQKMEQEKTKQTISFEDFEKLDLRIGEIISAEKVEKSDKLLKLELSLGELGQKTLLAGIAEKYSPSQLVGQQILVLSNLEPKKIRGIESQGMILVAENNEKEYVLVGPKKKVKPGAKLC